MHSACSAADSALTMHSVKLSSMLVSVHAAISAAFSASTMHSSMPPRLGAGARTGVPMHSACSTAFSASTRHSVVLSVA